MIACTFWSCLPLGEGIGRSAGGAWEYDVIPRENRKRYENVIERNLIIAIKFAKRENISYRDGELKIIGV